MATVSMVNSTINMQNVQHFVLQSSALTVRYTVETYIAFMDDNYSYDFFMPENECCLSGMSVTLYMKVYRSQAPLQMGNLSLHIK